MPTWKELSHPQAGPGSSGLAVALSSATVRISGTSDVRRAIPVDSFIEP